MTRWWWERWPYQERLPHHPAPADDAFAAVDADELLEFAEQSVELQWADRGRASGLVGKST